MRLIIVCDQSVMRLKKRFQFVIMTDGPCFLFFLLIILNMAPFFLFFNAARLFWLFCFFLSDRSRFRKCFIFFCESDQVTLGAAIS